MTQWGIDTLFNPGKRHMDEEKRRLQSTREEVGDSSGGRRIDLESGKVSFPGKDEPDSEGPSSQRPEPAEGAPEAPAEESDPIEQQGEPDAEEDTPAARARARRRRSAS